MSSSTTGSRSMLSRDDEHDSLSSSRGSVVVGITKFILMNNRRRRRRKDEEVTPSTATSRSSSSLRLRQEEEEETEEELLRLSAMTTSSQQEFGFKFNPVHSSNDNNDRIIGREQQQQLQQLLKNKHQGTANHHYHHMGDSSEEEDNTPIRMPEQFEISPHVSHIKAMVKVLKSITDAPLNNHTTPNSTLTNSTMPDLATGGGGATEAIHSIQTSTTMDNYHHHHHSSHHLPTNNATTTTPMNGSSDLLTGRPTMNQLILSMSYLRDLDLTDVSNQYAIVESHGIVPLLKLFSFKQNDEIRIGAASILSILSKNSRIQLKIADETGVLLLLKVLSENDSARSMTDSEHSQTDSSLPSSSRRHRVQPSSNLPSARNHNTNASTHQHQGKGHHGPMTCNNGKSKSSEDFIVFQCLVCEILANCCERVIVRRIFRNNQGLMIILSFLKQHGHFFSRIDGHHHQSEASRARSIKLKNPSTFLKRNHPSYSQPISSFKRKKLNEQLLIIQNSMRVLWSALKSKKNQEMLRRQEGINILSSFLESIMQYYMFYQSQQSLNTLAHETGVEGPLKLESPIKSLVPLIGCFMRCAENTRARREMEDRGVVDKLFKVAQTLNKNVEYGQELDLQIVIAGLINELCSDDSARNKFNSYGITSIFGQWIRQYDGTEKLIPSSKKRVVYLLELLTGALWKSTQLEVNSVDLMRLDMMIILVKLISQNNPLFENSLQQSLGSCENNVKISCTGIMSNCARLPEYREEMHKAGVVTILCQLFSISASTPLLVNCLDTLGFIADTSDILGVVLEENGMRAIWTMLRSDNPPVQAAAARAICNCVNNPEVAARIGEIFVSGMAALVRTLEQSNDHQVVGYCCQAIAKMSLYETNRAVLTEEGALLQLSRVLQATRIQFDEVINFMGQSLYSKAQKSHNNQGVPGSNTPVLTYSIDKIDSLNLNSPVLNKRLLDILFVKSHASTAIGELAKRKGNKTKLYEYGAVEPLVENLMLHPFLQAHFMANNDQTVDNFTMIEIVGKHNSKTNAHNQSEVVTNPPLSCTPPFTCNSTVCAQNSLKKASLVVPDLDCYYCHLFRNSSYALSVLSKEKIIAIALRMCNCVSLLTKLLSSRNDDLQIAAATCASNIRKYHVSTTKVGGNTTLLAPPTIRPLLKSRASVVSSYSMRDEDLGF